MANSRPIIIDHGMQHFVQMLHELQDKKVDVGLQGGVGSDIVNRAYWNEFGTIHSPERSFLRSTMTDKKDKLEAQTQKAFRNITNGSLVYSELGRLGLFLETETKKTVLNGTFDPNSPYTIQAKGSSKPLIDTSQMLGSIRFEIKG